MRADHRARRERFLADGKREDALSLRVSFVRLVTFGAAVVLIGAGISRENALWLWSGAGSFVLFLAAGVWHLRVTRRKERAETRARIHARHLARMDGDLPDAERGADLLSSDHAYASDIDVIGQGSLYARIDVTHTRRGRETLASWLGAPAADVDEIRARQRAVDELAKDVVLRQELEAAVLDGGDAALDARPFLEFLTRPAWVSSSMPLMALMVVLPLSTLACFALGGTVLPTGAWVVPLVLQALLVSRTEPRVRQVYALVVSRARFVESYAALLHVAETARFEAPRLDAVSQRLRASGAQPSAELRRLETWTGLFEMRTQGPLHVVLDYLLLWDLWCVLGIERWAARMGSRPAGWFEALGELEALASLATLRALDPDATMPEVADGGALEIEGLAHPLLPPGSRVANDVSLPGSGHALVITGSNMAGKSTLLRAVGLDVVLALAGGPVIAKRARIPRVRLRASMRIADSLQHGASYFQAELARLRSVVADAEDEPPILFLVDELLRGTNERARHRGARAVVLHLLARGALGLVATHDVALAELEEELSGKVRNAHFTDVMEGGEMKFDYRLQPGVVRTSNALRLLARAGIDVEVDDAIVDAPSSSRGASSEHARA